jgi:excisionase family DNA binding protein
MLSDYNNGQPEPLRNESEAAPGFGGTRCFEASDLFQFKLQYSRNEARKILNISLRTLDRLIEGKELPVRRIGRRVLVTRDALEKFIKRDHQTGMVH